MAHLSLAVCYSQGKGVEESVEKAFEHHQEASKSGNYIANMIHETKALHMIM